MTKQLLERRLELELDTPNMTSNRTSVRFDDQPLDNNLVASIACILDNANVPNVL